MRAAQRAHARCDFAKTSALFNSGAEAVENAVKIARHATRRQAVIVFDHAYHGRTNLTMALTAKNMPYKDGFGPFAPEVYRVPMSYPFRDPAGFTGDEAAAAGGGADRQAGGRGQRGVRPDRADPGGRRIRGTRPWLSAGLGRLVPGARRAAGRRRGAVGVLPDRGVVRLRARGGRTRPGRHGQGHRRRACRWPR